MTAGTAEQLEHLRLASRVAGLESVRVVLPEDRHAVVGGLRLHYLDWGPGGRPPLVFLHGGALTAHTWDLVCLALRERHRCLAVDQRGHGDSEWSPAMEYAIADHVRDLEGLLEELGLERPVLVGQSLGAANAMAYAARHSDRVSGLVLVDAGPYVRREGATDVAEFVLGPSELDSVDEFVERARTFNPQRAPELLRRSLLHNLRRLPGGKWTWKYDRRALSHAWFERLLAEVAQLSALLPSIRCPTLVVRGELSAVMTDADAARLARELPAGRWASVPGAGHTVQGDNPGGLVQAIEEFLALTGLTLSRHAAARDRRARRGGVPEEPAAQ